MLDLEREKNKCIGLNQSIKAIKESRAARVYLADDADAKIRTQVTALCEQMDVALETVETMKELGRLAGISVGSAIVTVLKDFTAIGLK